MESDNYSSDEDAEMADGQPTVEEQVAQAKAVAAALKSNAAASTQGKLTGDHCSAAGLLNYPSTASVA